MMSRHEQFPAQEKIVWLIENAVTVAGEGISITGTCSDINPEESHKYYQAMEDYIIEKPIPSQYQEELKSLFPTLDKMKKIRKTNVIFRLINYIFTFSPNLKVLLVSSKIIFPAGTKLSCSNITVQLFSTIIGSNFPFSFKVVIG